MKKYIIIIMAAVTAMLYSCKKNGIPAASSNNAACKPETEFTTLNGINATYKYTYNNDGKITTIKKFIGLVIVDSMVVGDNTTARYYQSSSGFKMVQSVVYNQSFIDGHPTEAQVALQEGAITQTDVWHYFFFYDSKNRLTKVGEQTDHVIGDPEYDLSITYDDKDNVIALRYENTTGPNAITTIVPLGYDDKPNPYTGIKNWYFLMHAGWDNYDTEPIFTALSKNNLLGYTTLDGTKRTTTYNYNDKGFPIKRRNTNTSISGNTYSFEETFDYTCK
jgi:hypothetical protein